METLYGLGFMKNFYNDVTADYKNLNLVSQANDKRKSWPLYSFYDPKKTRDVCLNAYRIKRKINYKMFKKSVNKAPD